jgi:predicted acylesterase/phospholipase RssA
MPLLGNATKPLGPIALALSGGGGRAAGFHLGTLACLDRLNLLQDVSILSTVSGGSFVGASYVLALKEAPAGEDLHRTFDNYFKSFKFTLLNSKLLPWALQQLANDRIQVPSGRHNLVTALAQVYHETFLHKAGFGMLWDGKPIHIKDVIFNATEFRTGLAFRFQKSDHPCVIGNDRVCIPEEHARAMRLADVVACSSCIPVGLEPLMFPDDFAWPDAVTPRVAAIKAELKKQCGVDTVPIMDGGVYDNQGIESAMLAVRRDPRHAASVASSAGAPPDLVAWFEQLLRSEQDLGTFIVSDTPLLVDEGFTADLPPSGKGLLTLRRLDVITRLLTAAALLTIGYLIGHLTLSDNQLNIWREIDDLFTYAIPITLAVLLLATLVTVRRKVREVLDAIPQSGHSAWRDVRHLTVTQLIEMLKLRLGSTWALTSWVYFNRIRQLGYHLLLHLPGARRHVMTHEIGDLLPHAGRPPLPEWLTPSAAAVDLARRASTLPTQLWFDSEADLDDTINCGRMTMYFNILAHFEREHPSRSEAQQRLYDRAKADWAILQADPSAMLPPLTGAAS